MNEREREEFLAEFIANPPQTLVGFAVMGGIFSEGIDLTGERISGAIIVGVGLPQLCREREIIRDYFEQKNGHGFSYAYIYPGMNKEVSKTNLTIILKSYCITRTIVNICCERKTAT